jgi:hypothetical protein
VLGDGESSVFLPRQNERTPAGVDAIVVGWGRTDQVKFQISCMAAVQWDSHFRLVLFSGAALHVGQSAANVE